jgi:hypothetical protein
MEMNWITNLVVFIVGLFDRYDNFVKKTAVKHLWVASALNVVGGLIFALVFCGIPILVMAGIIFGAIKLIALFPFFSCVVGVAVLFVLAMICSAGILSENLPKAEDKAEPSMPGATKIEEEKVEPSMPGAVIEDKEEKKQRVL